MTFSVAHDEQTSSVRDKVYTDVCAKCGKVFTHCFPEWGYTLRVPKNKNRWDSHKEYFCSYHCMREVEKQILKNRQEKMEKEFERAACDWGGRYSGKEKKKRKPLTQEQIDRRNKRRRELRAERKRQKEGQSQ